MSCIDSCFVIVITTWAFYWWNWCDTETICVFVLDILFDFWLGDNDGAWGKILARFLLLRLKAFDLFLYTNFILLDNNLRRISMLFMFRLLHAAKFVEINIRNRKKIPKRFEFLQRKIKKDKKKVKCRMVNQIRHNCVFMVKENRKWMQKRKKSKKEN